MSAVIKQSEAAVVEAFDYAGLDKATASEARALAERVRSFERRVTSEIIDLGGQLARMKERLGHGQFGPWLEAEFGDKVRTAQRYMLAHEAFGAKNDTVSYLPVSTVYALATAPQETRNEIVAEIEAGQAPKPAQVRQRASTARAEARAAAKLAKLTPEQRKELETKSKRQRRSAAQYEAKRRADDMAHELESLAVHRAAHDAVDQILDIVDPDVLRAILEPLPQFRDYVMTGLLRERIGLRDGLGGNIREYQRLTIRAENREREIRGEPPLPFPWDPPEESYP